MFGFGKNTFLGIDIGISSIKIVEIKVTNNKPILSNYAWMGIGSLGREIQDGSFSDDLGNQLKKLLREGGFKSTDAHVAIPAFGGLITLVEFPEMNKDDLDQAIKFEAHKYIPTSLDDVVLSWDVVNKKISDANLIRKKDEAEEAAAPPVSANSKLQVLLVAAPKSKVASYEKLVKSAGLSLKSIEIESFSILRSLIGNDLGNFVVVDIGARVCNIILVEKGVIKTNRNIDAGGRDLTKTIARSMDIDEERAERFKLSGKNLLGKEASVKLQTIDMIIAEIQRVMDNYYKNSKDRRIDKIILSGGTAGLSGIEDYFSQALGIKTVVGNPFSRIEYDKKLEAKINEMKSRFSVSVGLALRGAEDYLKK